jgi:hypothetical protein
MTICSTRLVCFGIVMSLGLLAGLGSTAAEACDPRVTTRQSDLWGGNPTYVVRDRRPRGAPSGSVTVTNTPRDPIVRDHRR